MAMQDVTSWMRLGALLGAFVIVILINAPGLTGIVCYTTVESLDLGCLLRWDCPHASPNTTYTVQTKTQGDPWRDVAWCIWVSSHTCDVTQAFSNFDLYNMVRVGAHLSTSSTVWMKPRKFDYTDFIFSAPSVSLSLQEDQLLVKVQFPCAANRRCAVRRCCPITELIDPLTTVTLYTKLSEYQSRTVWTQETVSFVEFSGLAPGQNYCAVANFSFPNFAMAASPRSSPQCIQTASHLGLLPVLYVGITLSMLLLVPLFVVFARRPRRASPANNSQPKSPPSVHDPISLVPLSLVPVDPVDIHVEVTDNVSYESSSSLPSSRSSPLGFNSDDHHGIGTSRALYCDSGGTEQGTGLDSGISIPHSSEDTGGTSDD